jgi:hypothetical protein
MKLKHLKRLHEQRLLPEQRLGRWEAPGEHRVPAVTEPPNLYELKYKKTLFGAVESTYLSLHKPGSP